MLHCVLPRTCCNDVFVDKNIAHRFDFQRLDVETMTRVRHTRCTRILDPECSQTTHSIDLKWHAEVHVEYAREKYKRKSRHLLGTHSVRNGRLRIVTLNRNRYTTAYKSVV